MLACGTYGNVIRLLPPLVISDALLDEGLTIIEERSRNCSGAFQAGPVRQTLGGSLVPSRPFTVVCVRSRSAAQPRSTHQWGAGMVGVAVAQFAPGMDKQANLRRAVELVRAAVVQRARLVVLPEYCGCSLPRHRPRFVAAAEPLDGGYVSGPRGPGARLRRVLFVAGSNEAVDTIREPVRKHDSWL